MRQRVKNISYLAKSVVDLTTLKPNEAKDIIILPKGAEVIQVDVEVIEATQGATIDLGLNDNTSFFTNDIDTSGGSFYKVAKGASINANSKLNITINQDPNGSGKVSVRVVYFLPTEYEYEI